MNLKRWCVGAAATVVLVVSSAALVSDGAASAGPPRFPQLTLEQTSGEQRVLAERMLKETRVGLGGPWGILVRSPRVGTPLLDLYNHFRRHTGLPQRLVELSIVITSREWAAPYEWYIHYPLAVEQGVAPEALADIRIGQRPSALKADEMVAYEFATELLRRHVVSEATFRKTQAALGDEQLVDLTALIGTYVSIGAALNMGEVMGEVGDGPGFLPPPRP